MASPTLQGHLLIAANDLKDPNFAQSVVLIVQHNEDGAMGLIINRPTRLTVSEAWGQVSDEPCDCDDYLHQGGPCDGPLMALHNEAQASEVIVASGIYFTASGENMHDLVAQAPKPIKFMVGYAGWTAGQLENEMASGSWLTLPATEELVFQSQEGLWESLMKSIERSKIFAALNVRHLPEDPSLN